MSTSRHRPWLKNAEYGMKEQTKYPRIRETRKTREATGGILGVPLAWRVFQVLRVHIYFARSPISRGIGDYAQLRLGGFLICVHLT